MTQPSPNEVTLSDAIDGKVLALARALEQCADHAPTDSLPGAMREVAQKLSIAIAEHRAVIKAYQERSAAPARTVGTGEAVATANIVQVGEQVCHYTTCARERCCAEERCLGSPAPEQTDDQCICKGNLRLIIKESEPLLDRKFRDRDGRICTFYGVVCGSDDLYYGMSSEGRSTLLSCVGSIEGHGYELIEPGSPGDVGLFASASECEPK